MGKSSILIAKKRLAGCIVHLAIIFILVWAAWAEVERGTVKSSPPVVVDTCYAVFADGREALFYDGIGCDSAMFSPKLGTLSRQQEWQSVSAADPRLLKCNSECLKSRAAALRKCVAEADYYLLVHRVQDEGYEFVALRRRQMKAESRNCLRMAYFLDSISKHSHTVCVGTKIRRTPCLGSRVFVDVGGCVWRNGQLQKSAKNGRGVSWDDSLGVICGEWRNDTLVSGRLTGADGVYEGDFSPTVRADGHGAFFASTGTCYDGHWTAGRRNGFGVEIATDCLHAGEWCHGRFLGERMNHTSERIYGIDISRYQHGKGRKYYPIHWKKLRITYLGRQNSKRMRGKADYPVSFVYIKSTEGTTVRNRFYASDYRQARRYGIACGAYHFFSTRTGGAAQARFFLKHARFSSGDFPPVLDVEPSDRQIAAMGGRTALFREIRAWMRIVENRTGARPVLYVSQQFVNKYLRDDSAIKRNYSVWIARYGQYKPDVRLVFWQLCSDGRVTGIHGEVDINVFNGYSEQFKRFKSSECI